MSTNTSNHLVNPAAREAMDKFKMEADLEQIKKAGLSPLIITVLCN